MSRITFFIFTALVILCAGFFPSVTHAATGDITSVRITEDGWYAEVDIEGFVDGGLADYGLGQEDDVYTTAGATASSQIVDNDPIGAKVVFTVTSQGYNTSGVLGTITRTVYGTKTLRKPYPHNTLTDHNVLDEDDTTVPGTLRLKVALSEFVYVDDEAGSGKSGTDVTVSIPASWYRNSGTGGNSAYNNALTNFTVTNNSALPYPQVIGRWAWPGYERVTSDFLVEATAFHRFGQNGKPLAAIAFQASDQSGNSSYATTTDMTTSTRTGDANTVLVYAGTMDVDVLDQAEVLDVNFTAYPWVGDESSVLNSRVGLDGFTQPEQRLGPLHMLNDKSGTYGVGYAYVDSVNGNDVTGTVYSSQAAAEAGNAFRTIGHAASSTKIYHNANASPTRNSAGGAVILLAEGNHAYPGTVPTSDLGTTMDTWLIIKPASTASKANTKISSGAGGTSNTLKATRVKIEGLTLSPSVASGVTNVGINGRAATDVLWLHNNTINATTTAPILRFKAMYATQNSVTALTNGFGHQSGANAVPGVLTRGNTSSSVIEGHFYTILGNNGVWGKFIEESTSAVTSAGMATSTNVIYAFNTLYNMSTGMDIAQTSTSTGIAVVQNLFERVGGDSTGVISISSGGGGGIATTSNVLFWHNTSAGERYQWGYNESGTISARKLNWGTRFNIFTEWGEKTDTFNSDPNGVRIGNWALVHSVGNIGDKVLTSSFQSDFHGFFTHFGPTASYLPTDFIEDNSKDTGSNDGNGTYTLLATSTAIDIATTTSNFYHVLPYDLLGNPRYGSPDAGVYEYQPPYTMGTHEVATSSIVRVYGDEKWRPRSATTTTGTADLSITLPGTDRTQWLDIAVSTWQDTGTRHKVWTETSSTTALTNTVHVVGDLDASTPYEVSVDGVVGQNITGDSCTSGVCTSNGSGEITFTYTGSYSSHEFDVEEQVDSDAPTITNVSSDKANGTYGVGEVIEIDVTFSEAVTSTGNVTVTLETGSTDRTCTFTVSSATSGSCNYMVQDGDASSDLTVSSISGTIADGASNAMSNFVPATNLAANKALVIDTTEEEEEETPVSGGGSSSGSRSVHYTNIYTQTTAPISVATGSISYSYGDRNIAIKNIQSYLNAKGYPVSSSGAGSPGFETDYFGPATRAALQKFQCTVMKICSGTFYGVADAETISVLSAPSQNTSAKLFSRTMSLGSTGIEVKNLQLFLNARGFTVATSGAGSPGKETSYFGPATREAVRRFQEHYVADILTPLGLTRGNGVFGPATMKKINTLLAH